jgi:hypothetical protein
VIKAKTTKIKIKLANLAYTKIKIKLANLDDIDKL